ncbi:MAG: hypothetical protein FWH51_03840 [Dehalococcoidia bacterium]|nr:hypothetical protein [Dehalococcoidia bacterium]
MPNRIKQIGMSLLSSLLSIAVYGIGLYFLTTWLAGFSLLLAYLANLVIIILGLTVDELGIRTYQSEKYVMRMKQEKDVEKSVSYLQRGLNIAVSFKTDLYLFYIFVLIVSQIIDFNPTLADEVFGNFIRIASHGILLLIALDMLIGQFTKDRGRMKELSAKLRKEILG